LAEGAAVDHRVGVEQADVVAAADPQTLVVAPRESAILAVVQDAQPGPPALDRSLEAVVRAGVVRDDDLDRREIVGEETVQTRSEQRPGVVVEDDDRQLRTVAVAHAWALA